MHKLLFFSDIHLDAVTAGKPRKVEIVAFVERLWHIAEQEQVDLIGFCGDAYDPGSLIESSYSAALIKTFINFSRVSSGPAVVAIAGNHDVIDASEHFMQQPVTTLTPLRSACQQLPREQSEMLHVFDRPMTRLVKPGLAVLSLPYVSRVHLPSLPTWEAHAAKVARDYVQQGNKLVVMAHRVIPGARMTSESIEMARGQDQIFPFALIADLRPSFVTNGHYHAAQTITVEGVEIHIPGSPARFTFGDVDDVAKGALLAQI